MGKYTSRYGLPKVRVGGTRRHYSTYSLESTPVTPEPLKELSKEMLFMATMKFIIHHDNKIKYTDVQMKIAKSTTKNEDEALAYLQALLDNGYLSKEFIGHINYISVTKKACDKIRAIKEA